MIDSRPYVRSRLPRRVAGIALIEAMLALGVAMAAVVGVLWFNATILGSSANNRVNSAAMLAAQAKIEELRNTPFVDVVGGNDIVAFESPGFVGQATISVNRCWSVNAVQHSGVVVPDISQLVVAAVGGGAVCDTTNTATPVRLVSLLAKSDPRLAAQNSIANAPADGKGKVVSGHPKPADGTPRTPSGFTVERDANGNITAISTPEGGPALVPAEGGSLKFATINGNVMFDGARTAAAFAKLLVRIEGNALCRVYFPGSNVATPAAITPPVLTGGAASMAYVQYSCVVADGWRRSISVLTGNTNEKVCVGYPAMQPENVNEDYLESAGRQYVGRKAGAQTGEWVWEGVRGSTVSDGEGAAVIGSVCAAGEPCAGNTEPNSPRGWVPGGHHYFVMNKSDGLCADRIEALGKAIDDAKANQTLTDTQMMASLYTNYFFRNPHKVYCTNDKVYTNTLPPIPADEEFTTSDCYSYTKVSGFINQSAGIVVNGNQIVFGSSSPYYAPCRAMGAYGNFGGGYLCGFPESATTSLTPFLTAQTFTPGSYSGLAPLTVPLDFVRKSFSLGSSGGTCASETKTWAVGNLTCQGTIASANNAASMPVNTVVGAINQGSATFVCNGSSWGATPTSATCSSEPPAAVTACTPFSVAGKRSGNKTSVELSVGGSTVPCSSSGSGSNSTYSCSVSSATLGGSYAVTEKSDKGVLIATKSNAVEASGCQLSSVNFP